MQQGFLKYDKSNLFIQKDLKKLKHWRSLKNDLFSIYKIAAGALSEKNWPPPVNFFGGLITHIKSDSVTFLCYKHRIKITNPKISHRKGGRLIYGLIVESRAFIPLLVFPASEEGKFYSINNKKFRLTSSNFAYIINEKLKLLN